MKEHFDIVNNETMFGVHNKGMVLIPISVSVYTYP